jgi:pre-mRNA-splicing factor 18
MFWFQRIAHVMNNEMQRKYLQSIKRLIGFEQNRRVDVPPSKKVM